MIIRYVWMATVALSLAGQNLANLQWSSKNYSATLTSNHAEVIGYYGDKYFKALIEIMHASGPNETFTLNIRIPNASKFEFLNLNEFAGPGSPAGKKKVLTIRPTSMKGGYTFFGEGGFTSDYSLDEFTIDLATPRDTRKSLFKLLNKAVNSSEEWTIRIASPSSSSQFVLISFNFIGTQDYLKSILR